MLLAVTRNRLTPPFQAKSLIILAFEDGDLVLDAFSLKRPFVTAEALAVLIGEHYQQAVLRQKFKVGCIARNPA
jgi:hypothetical protein